MRRELRGQVALVTGSAHRVGKAIALELARRGVHQVVHFNKSEAEAIQTSNEIAALGVQTTRITADQSDPTQVETLFEAIQTKYGRLDILVNSASIFDQGDLLTLGYDDWQRSLAVNLTGPFLCTQHAARLMRAGGHGGAIINISDNSGLKGWKAYPQHSVSKAALLMLTKVAARALAPRFAGQTYLCARPARVGGGPAAARCEDTVSYARACASGSSPPLPRSRRGPRRDRGAKSTLRPRHWRRNCRAGPCRYQRSSRSNAPRSPGARSR